MFFPFSSIQSLHISNFALGFPSLILQLLIVPFVQFVISFVLVALKLPLLANMIFSHFHVCRYSGEITRDSEIRVEL